MATECALTPGDVINRIADQPDDDNMVNATVKSSKKDECAIGATVAVSVDDLQEMHNQLQIQMDAGLRNWPTNRERTDYRPLPIPRRSRVKFPRLRRIRASRATCSSSRKTLMRPRRKQSSVKLTVNRPNRSRERRAMKTTLPAFPAEKKTTDRRSRPLRYGSSRFTGGRLQCGRKSNWPFWLWL